jgi:hypothetical protein
MSGSGTYMPVNHAEDAAAAAANQSKVVPVRNFVKVWRTTHNDVFG